MGFQGRVNRNPAPGVAGDFYGANPRQAVLAPQGGFQAAPDYPLMFGGALLSAAIVGRFAWGNPVTGLMANYFQPASRVGVIHREEQTIITKFLGEDRLGVQQGFPLYAFASGDMFVDFAPGPATAGKKVYADPVTGEASVDVTGQSVICTGYTIAINHTTGVGTIAAAGTGTIAAGQVVSDGGVNIPPGTFITALLSSTGGDGTVQLNQAPAADVVAQAATFYGKQETRFSLASPVAGAVSFTGEFIGAGSPLVGDGVLTVTGGVTGGSLAPGQRIAGSGVPAFAVIYGQLPGGTPGGDGTYTTNCFIVQNASEAMTASQGTLGKISTWQL